MSMQLAGFIFGMASLVAWVPAQEMRIGMLSPELSQLTPLPPAHLTSMRTNGYTHVMIPIDAATLFWSWRGDASRQSVSPWVTSGASQGSLTTDGKRFLQTMMGNAIAQASSSGLNVIPMVSLGAHGETFSMTGAPISWNRRRIVPSRVNPPDLPGGGGYRWVNQDIGAVGIAGNASMNKFLSEPEIRINASGSDIWGTADQFRFVFNGVISSGFSLSARVASQANTNAWAKTGVMIRQSSAANSPYVAVFLTPANGIVMQHRSTSGGISTQTARLTGTTQRFLRITRNGNSFTGEVSADGSVWQLLGTAAVTMNGTVLAGLAHTSHNNSSLGMAVFTKVAAPFEGNYLCTPHAPDGAFDRVFLDLLRTWRAALDEARAAGRTAQATFNHVHLGHDENFSHGDIIAGNAYLLIGEGGVDRNWFNARLTTDNMAALVPRLMGEEISRRHGQVRASDVFGSACRVMFYGDMWDVQSSGGALIRNYLNSETVQTWRVLDNASASAIRNDLVVMPWQYDRERYYQTGLYDTRSALRNFASRGYPHIYVYATNTWNQTSIAQLAEWVKWSRAPEFSATYRGYAAHYFPDVGQPATMFRVFPYLAQSQGFRAALD